MIKPYRSLLLLLYVAILLGITLYFLPTNIKINDQITLRTFTFRSIFEKSQTQYADISDIQQKFEKESDEVVLEPNEKDTASAGEIDTNIVQIPVNQTNYSNPTQPEDLKKFLSDSLESRFRLQYPEGQDTLLFAFFRSLQQSNKHLIRILHYGDSQIEGDRITAPFRYKMQEQFGGCGVGLIPLSDPLGNRSSIVIKSDGNFKRFMAFGQDYSRRNQRNYGILGSYFRTNPYIVLKDTTVSKDSAAKFIYIPKKWQTGSVSYYRSSIAYPRENQFETIKILYSNRKSPIELSIYSQRDTLEKYKLEADSASVCRIYERGFHEPFSKVRISVGSASTPELYGVALDCRTGVSIDNMPFRGSSGVEFTQMNANVLREQFRKLNVKLVVLQFGVNVVPYITKDYSFYENQFYSQLRFIKSLSPDVSVLVVSVSDMSRRVEGEYVSYPNVEKIRDAQRRAAFRAGCAFWDLYEAMGGQNSMPSWVFNKPALANKDFTHFTPRGATLVAEMLFKAVMAEYAKFNMVQ
jgi:hypothetical protein